jgi:hypothetical protein
MQEIHIFNQSTTTTRNTYIQSINNDNKKQEKEKEKATLD